MTTRETINKKSAIHKKRDNPTLPSIDALKNGARSWEILARHLYELISDEQLQLSSSSIQRLNKLSKNLKSPLKPGRKSEILTWPVKTDMAKLCINVKIEGKFKSNIEAARYVAELATRNPEDVEATENLAKNLAKRMSEYKE